MTGANTLGYDSPTGWRFVYCSYVCRPNGFFRSQCRTPRDQQDSAGAASANDQGTFRFRWHFLFRKLCTRWIVCRLVPLVRTKTTKSVGPSIRKTGLFGTHVPTPPRRRLFDSFAACSQQAGDRVYSTRVTPTFVFVATISFRQIRTHSGVLKAKALSRPSSN